MTERTQSAGPLISGTLYVVATPIGNLSDLTDRARETLATVDVVVAEDTRHSGHLLKHLGISKTLISLHEHNESARAGALVARLKAGENLALISDAGTPLISDPGFGLVRAAIADHIRVVPIPGACAIVAALSCAGLPTDRFAFEGFLPVKEKQRAARLADVKNDSRTLVFYEAPHRLREMLSALGEGLGMERQAVIVREMTKQFESIYRGTLGQLIERAGGDDAMNRGELVVVVEGNFEVPATTLEADRVLRVLLSELAPAQAAKLAARITDGKRDELYRRALELNTK